MIGIWFREGTIQMQKMSKRKIDLHDVQKKRKKKFYRKSKENMMLTK